MRSIPQALLWEGLVRGRWSVLGMFLVGNATPCMVYEALSGYRISLNETALPFLVLQFSFLQLIILQFAIGIAIAQGPMPRLFTWPISSHAIVAWHSLSGSLLLAVETALAASLYNWLFQVGWPILGPAVFAAVAWTAIQLLQFIRVQPSLSGMCLWSSPLLFLIFWLSSRYGSFLSPPTHYWCEATNGDLLTLALVAAICYRMAIAGVRIARSGEQLPQIGFSDWLSRQWESLTLRSSIRSNFRSAVHAQLWHEFKLRGWAPPFIASIVTSLAMIAIARVVITGDWSLIESREILSTIPRSHRINPLANRTQRLCVAIVLAIFVAAYLCRPTNPPIVAFPLVLAVASLAVLPFAALPLTIGASRHR